MNLSGVRLKGADLRGANLEGMDLSGLDLRSVRLGVEQAVLLARCHGAKVVLGFYSGLHCY